MTTDERLGKLEKELARAKRFNCWLLVAGGLALGVWILAGSPGATAAETPRDVDIANGIRMAEVLRDTHAFYEDAWTKLVWTLGIGGTVMLVVLPILLEWSRRETLRVDRESIRREIDEGVTKARDMTVQQISPTLANLANSVLQAERNMQEARREASRMMANTLHSFGGMSSQNNRYLTAASFIWVAAQHRFLLEDSDQVIASTLEAACRQLVQAKVEEALDDREPLDAMQQLAAWFAGRTVGPRSHEVLINLVNQLNQFSKQYGEAVAKQAGTDSKQGA